MVNKATSCSEEYNRSLSTEGFAAPSQSNDALVNNREGPHNTFPPGELNVPRFGLPFEVVGPST